MSTETERRYRRERLALQIALLFTAGFPLVLGGAVALTGLSGFYMAFGLAGPVPADPTLESAVRFLASNFVGMGLLVLWVVPRVERRVAPFRIFVATALLGASMRILAHLQVGAPNTLTTVLIGVEVSILGLGLWQTRVHRLWRATAQAGSPPATPL